MCKECIINKDLYEVHDGEKIWSKWFKRYLNGNINKYGYIQVELKCIDGKYMTFQYHRVIWYFINGEIPDGMQINHIDENKLNNHISNLNLMTPKENTNWGTGIERSAAKRKGVFNTKRSIAVVAVKDGEVVMEFESMQEAQRHGFYEPHVSACCLKKRETHKGYRWFWKDEWLKIKNYAQVCA